MSIPAEVHEVVTTGLAAAYARIRDDGAPDVAFDGALLRPTLSFAGAAHTGEVGERMWLAALAVQLAHEASLVHDDVIDGASMRRGRPTIVARGGIARALVEGDHLLTMAYRAAAATGSMAFATAFARAVERTVAAEKLQGRMLGQRVDRDTYTRIVGGKSGELIACALAAAPLLAATHTSDADAYLAFGCEIGVAYQMLDDLLDYCAAADLSKPTLGDYRQQRWTWPLDELPGARFGLGDAELAALVHAPRAEWSGASAFARMCQMLDERIAWLIERSAVLLPRDTIVATLLESWRARIGRARDRERTARRELVLAALTERLGPEAGDADDALRRLARGSVTFRFASRLLPADEVARIARVYAFCRVTDDLVDDAADPTVTGGELLETWLGIARASYEGTPSGIALVDRPMAEMAAAGVPFDNVRELAEGMRMDLKPMRYETMADLRAYTHRVAGVVGLWIARLVGVSDPLALENAERMGHAMQLTNIVRDVGEDWRRGRVYLPSELLARHALSPADVGAFATGARPLDPAYRAVLDELMRMADAEYDAAFAWLTALPAGVQPAMAVAARVYAGIHAALRGNGYDNLTRRARTSLARKTLIALGALAELHRVRRDHPAPIHPVVAKPAHG